METVDVLFVLLDENVQHLALDERKLSLWILRCIVVESFVDSKHRGSDGTLGGDG
jgi:hypothetical protein